MPTPWRGIKEGPETLSTETLLRRYWPSVGVGSIPLVQGIRWNPTWKAIPSKSAVKDRKADKGFFFHFPYELFWVFFRGFGFSPILWSGFPTLTSFIRYPTLRSKQRAYFQMVFSVVYGNGETSSPINSYRAGYPGRLAYSTDSGAGKRRLFAIGNFGLQRLLSPFLLPIAH